MNPQRENGSLVEAYESGKVVLPCVRQTCFEDSLCSSLMYVALLGIGKTVHGVLAYRPQVLDIQIKMFQDVLCFQLKVALVLGSLAWARHLKSSVLYTFMCFGDRLALVQCVLHARSSCWSNTGA